VPAEKLALCVVGESGSLDLHSISFGDTISSWANAAEVCAATHVTYLDEPVDRVISIIPEMYEDIWTGAKGFYKLEPAVADGGEVVIYAPHITEISTSHPEINEIGYHCRDYFVKQWDRFKHIHWGTLAHSTHLRGAGTYDAETGEERSRRRSPRTYAVPPTSATSTPPPSTSPPRRRAGRSSCRTPARSSSGCADLSIDAPRGAPA
jgi:nickel-dependent lactate racemase